MAANAVPFNLPEPVKLVGSLLTSTIKIMGFSYELQIPPIEMKLLDVDRRTDMEKAKAAELFIAQSIKDYSKWMKR
jgi:hypothetical protein